MGGIKMDKSNFPSNLEQFEKLSSRMIVTSSIIGQPSDGPPGEGGPFVNSLIRVLIKNTDEKLSISKLVRETSKEMNTTSPNSQMIPGIGILRNSKHEGGEFSFRLKEEFIELSKDGSKAETELLEKSIRESMKKLEQEFITKLESNQKMYEERIKKTEEKTLVKTKSSSVKELRGLLINDKIEKFFDEIDLIQDAIDDEILTPLFVLQSRWNATKNQSLLGVITKQEEYAEKNKIRKGLIELSASLKINTNK